MTTVLPDRPISAPAEDFLDRDAFAQNIADLILHAPPQGSLRIGVYGGWGEGKTSVLKLIHGHLCDAGHVCVWLTPWISSNREEVVEQLVRGIAAELKIDIDKLDVAKGTVQLAERLRKPAAEINIKFKLAESVFGPIVQTVLRTFFERKGLTKKATNCLNMRAQPHCKRFMAYDNCPRYSAADACGSSTTTEVPYCVVCHYSCPTWARHLS